MMNLLSRVCVNRIDWQTDDYIRDRLKNFLHLSSAVISNTFGSYRIISDHFGSFRINFGYFPNVCSIKGFGRSPQNQKSPPFPLKFSVVERSNPWAFSYRLVAWTLSPRLLYYSAPFFLSALDPLPRLPFRISRASSTHRFLILKNIQRPLRILGLKSSDEVICLLIFSRAQHNWSAGSGF